MILWINSSLGPYHLYSPNVSGCRQDKVYSFLQHLEKKLC